MKKYNLVEGRGINAAVRLTSNVSGEAVRSAKTLSDMGKYSWVREVEYTPGGRVIGTSVYWKPKMERHDWAKE
jgi:hypothetical protein